MNHNGRGRSSGWPFGAIPLGVVYIGGRKVGDLVTCEACGCRFEFIRGPGSALIPVQKVRTVYRLDSGGRLEKVPVQITLDDLEGGLYVSHFETCSSPARFSRQSARG